LPIEFEVHPDFAGLTKIELVPRKTRRKKKNRKVVLPIHPVFAAWLKKQTRGIGKAPVFPCLAGRSGAGKSGLSMGISSAISRNGSGRSFAKPYMLFVDRTACDH
jgi:pantothenate kinase-related protein Tda10